MTDYEYDPAQLAVALLSAMAAGGDAPGNYVRDVFSANATNPEQAVARFRTVVMTLGNVLTIVHGFRHLPNPRDLPEWRDIANLAPLIDDSVQRWALAQNSSERAD